MKSVFINDRNIICAVLGAQCETIEEFEIIKNINETFRLTTYQLYKLIYWFYYNIP